jgi:hypothetical protein
MKTCHTSPLTKKNPKCERKTTINASPRSPSSAGKRVRKSIAGKIRAEVCIWVRRSVQDARGTGWRPLDTIEETEPKRERR